MSYLMGGYTVWYLTAGKYCTHLHATKQLCHGWLPCDCRAESTLKYIGTLWSMLPGACFKHKPQQTVTECFDKKNVSLAWIVLLPFFLFGSHKQFDQLWHLVRIYLTKVHCIEPHWSRSKKLSQWSHQSPFLDSIGLVSANKMLQSCLLVLPINLGSVDTELLMLSTQQCRA